MYVFLQLYRIMYGGGMELTWSQHKNGGTYGKLSVQHTLDNQTNRSTYAKGTCQIRLPIS